MTKIALNATSGRDWATRHTYSMNARSFLPHMSLLWWARKSHHAKSANACACKLRDLAKLECASEEKWLYWIFNWACAVRSRRREATHPCPYPLPMSLLLTHPNTRSKLLSSSALRRTCETQDLLDGLHPKWTRVWNELCRSGVKCCRVATPNEPFDSYI